MTGFVEQDPVTGEVRIVAVPSPGKQQTHSFSSEVPFGKAILTHTKQEVERTRRIMQAQVNDRDRALKLIKRHSDHLDAAVRLVCLFLSMSRLPRKAWWRRIFR